MIWANITKEVRRDKWFVAKAPNQENVRAAAEWCRNQPGTGKFYNHYTNTRWWFEHEQDAVLFALRWS